MVGFKAKVRASAYLTKLGWICGWVFVGGVCMYVRDGYGWVGWVLEGKGKRNYTIISYLLHHFMKNSIPST